MTVAQLKRRVTIKCTGCAIERMQKTLRFTADWLAGQMTVKWNTRAPAAPPREVVEASTCMSEQGGAKSAAYLAGYAFGKKVAERALYGPPPTPPQAREVVTEELVGRAMAAYDLQCSFAEQTSTERRIRAALVAALGTGGEGAHCLNCGAPWDTRRCNACQCGASIEPSGEGREVGAIALDGGATVVLPKTKETNPLVRGTDR
jgi:hypothetical protein